MTSPRLLAVGRIKGGIGSTSLAVTLAVAALRAGRRVVLLDLDPQASASRWIQRSGLAVPIINLEPSDDPRGAAIAAVSEALERGELVVADPPPSAPDVLRVLVAVADLLAVPCGPSLEELHLARRVLEIAAQEAKLSRAKVRAVLVPCRIDARTSLGADVLGLLAELGHPVAPVLAPRIAWAEAASAGVPVQDLPPSRAADAIREADAVAAAILRLIP